MPRKYLIISNDLTKVTSKMLEKGTEIIKRNQVSYAMNIIMTDSKAAYSIPVISMKMKNILLCTINWLTVQLLFALSSSLGR